MLRFIENILLILFVVSITGYILSVLKEKIYLKNNMIVINKKSVTQKHIDEADMKEFIFDGHRVKSGDEIKVILKGNKIIHGILIGAKRQERAILMVTHSDEIKKICIDNVKKFRIISKYGKFFKKIGL